MIEQARQQFGVGLHEDDWEVIRSAAVSETG